MPTSLCGASLACATLHEVSRNSTAIFTATDTSPEFEELVRNYACHLRALHITPVVWALDEATHRKLSGWPGLRSVFDESVSLPSQAHPNAYKKPSSDEYTTAVSLKPLVILKVLQFGLDALFLDVDIALAIDPLPIFAMSRAPVQASLNYDDRPDASQSCHCAGPDLNTGVLYVRSSSAAARKLVDRWATHTRERHACPRRPPLWSCGDQEQLTRLLKHCGWRGLTFAEVAAFGKTSNQQHLTCPSGGIGSLAVEALPPTLFASGMSIRSWPRYGRGKLAAPNDLVTFHPNFGGFAGGAKKAALRRIVFRSGAGPGGGERSAWCIGE